MKMGRFQSCKSVLERNLRRAFYDGVLELYESHGSSDTVTAVTLEGTLTLTINKVETLFIRLSEVAQRAQELSLEKEDPCHVNSQEQHHSSVLEKEAEFSAKKRKQEPDDEKDDDKKTGVIKKLKTENTAQETKTETGPEHEHSVKAEKEPELPQQSGENKCAESPSKPLLKHSTESPESCSSVIHIIKKEPEEAPPVEYVSEEAFPGPSSSVSSSSKAALPEPEESADIPVNSRSPLVDFPKGIDFSSHVEVKAEPQVVSIVIEDDGDSEEEAEDLSGASCRSSSVTSTVQQASPVHTLWYRRPPASGSRRASAREHSLGRHVPSPERIDTTDPHPVPVVLERSDCPVCGEVLHTRRDLGQHLHSHRRALQASCSVCRLNTLTLDALLLHLSAVHSPRLMPALPPTLTPSSLALMPALPFAPSPMSAIASLVSMAACQAGPSSAAAFLAGGMVGGMSSLLEQIVTYRGLLPCPLCQLLCSSRQHLATHMALTHGAGSAMFGGQMGVGEEEAGEEMKTEGSSDGEGSGNFSCFDCSLVFSSQAVFTQHCLLQHNSTSVVSQGSCSVCHRAFHTWKSLHAHYVAAHSITTFCERCKMGFLTTAELKIHFDSVHSSDTRDLAFICDICNKGFYSQSQCSAHKRSHISEKSFSCQVCGSAFFKRGDLSKHFRTVHAPNRVFACRFCGKRGTRMDNMRSHVKSHGKHMTRDEVLSFIEEVSPN